MLANNLNKVLAIFIFCAFLAYSYWFNVEAAHAGYNSMLEWESTRLKMMGDNSGKDDAENLKSFITNFRGFVKGATECLSGWWEFSAHDANENICLPNVIDGTSLECINATRPPDKRIGTSAFTVYGIVAILAGTAVAVAAAAYISFIALPIAIGILVGLIIVVAPIFSSCLNYYVLAPHEYMNLENKTMECKVEGDTIVNAYKRRNSQDLPALTEDDVPYFYNCNKQTYGYLGDDRCSNPTIAKFGEKYQNLIGSIIVQKVENFPISFEGAPHLVNSYLDHPRCDPEKVKKDRIILSQQQIREGHRHGGKEISLPWPFNTTLTLSRGLFAYYTYKNGAVRLCAAVDAYVQAVVVGCTYVPPPLELNHAEIPQALQGTRCIYLTTGRTDLYEAGLWVDKMSANADSRNPVALFLMSDMHLTSTVYGCLKDMLHKILLGDQNKASFMKKVQTGMQKIVFAVLLLYVMMVGLKIIIAQQPPQTSEWIMYIVKFAFILYFATGDIWYDNNKFTGKKSPGLYTVGVELTSVLIDKFMQAGNSTDPLMMCNFQLNKGSLEQSNILSERRLSIGGSKGTIMPHYKPGEVQMTVWDYIDCKIVNYLNMGSCKYDIGGLVSFWLFFAGFWTALMGSGALNAIMLSIASAVYAVLLMLIIFRLVHIAILSLFAFTILVLVSPIVSCLALFEYTKEGFKSYIKTLIGYILYPAIVFAVIPVMLSTFDSVFYGDPERIEKAIARCSGQPDCKITYDEICAGRESVFCGLSAVAGSSWNLNNCSATQGEISGRFIEKKSVLGFYNIYVLKSSATDKITLPAIKLLLFAIIFYFFMNTATAFAESILQLMGTDDISRGSFNVLSIGSLSTSPLKSILPK